MSERIVSANGVDLCVEAFGDPSDPPILLVAGAVASMDMWEVDLCERLAAGGRLVIRYDLRDTGHSVTYEPGAAPYSFADLVADAIGLLDFYGIERAHWVGMSMGSGICQLAVLDHPERVATVTLIGSSPEPGAEDLPSIPADVAAAFRALAEPDWSDRAAVVDYLVEQSRISAARSVPFDEAEARSIVDLMVARSANPQSANNHFSLGGRGGDDGEDGDDTRARLARVTTPTLIVHGDEDPVFPLPHGVAMAKEIPGAELLTLEATGHELPRRIWDTLVPAILRHTAP
jgi:pimeloyl-ACP methyl ester carboxylesterase